MTLRIALAGFAHETNTFSKHSTDLDEFEANGIYRGPALLALSGSNSVLGGAVDAILANPEFEPIPLVAASAIPAGPVTANAVDAIEGEIVDGLERERPDAVVLDLHGAMITERSDDGEADTLRRVRAVVGPTTPIVAILDPHANVGQEMVDLADQLLPYDTYPHVDLAARGAEAVAQAARIARGELRPTTALHRLPLMSASSRQFTGDDPARAIMEHAFAIERRPDVINAAVCWGFMWADTPLTSMSVLVTTDADPDLAGALARDLAAAAWDRREAFRPRALSVEEAIHAAMEESVGPVVLADAGDNPGGGSACDGTALLWALLDLGAPGAALAVIADADAVAIAFAAGEGAHVELALGGKTDDRHGYPVPVTATVRSLSDGSFVYEGPIMAGIDDTLGRTAVLTCDGRYGNTVDVIVCERRVQALDLALFRSQGIEPTERKILAVKSAVHFRAAFAPIASRIIEVDTPGLTGIDPVRFDFRRLRRPIWPLDPI